MNIANLAIMVRISKKQEKLIRSLKQKKFRQEQGLFVIEGVKLHQEAVKSSFEFEMTVLLEGFEEIEPSSEYLTIDEPGLKRLSSFKTPPGILAVLKIPEQLKATDPSLTLMLDDIRDPGNLGTIIRAADAFGVDQIICSNTTVDLFNPKVVQASMGSIFHLPIIQTDLKSFLSASQPDFKVYGLHLEGKDLYQEKLDLPAIVVMGNESNGLSEEIQKLIEVNLKIPMRGEAESLNVSMATTVILAEFQRRML